MRSQRILYGLGLLALLLAAPATRGQVFTFTEQADAGSLPAAAQPVAGPLGAPVAAIFGTLANTADVDVYLIFIDNPAAFSATTVNLFGPPTLNTQLFLFDTSGRGVYANDDASAATIRSTLPAGNPNGPQAAGAYFLAISSFDRDPVNAAGQLLFPSFPFTGVNGPTGPGGGSPVSDFEGGGVSQGIYRIDLTGVVAVPEPGSALLLAAGLAGVLVYRRARRLGRRAA